MLKKKTVLWTLITIILASAVGTGCFFAGRATADSDHKAQLDYNIKLNRSDLDGLGEIDGEIYVTGHKSPDTDTVGSSIAYAALLKQLGYDAKPVVLGSVNRETAYVLEQVGLETPELLEDASGCNLVLVDHSDYSQSASGLNDANVISIIDHHNDGSVITGNQLIYDARPLGSTATIIWLRYRNYGLTPDKQTAGAMAGAILSDTDNLKSASTTFADREALKELSALADINDIGGFYNEMYKASISYEGMSDEEIFLSDYKEYESGGKKYSIGCINAYDEADAKDFVKRMKNNISSYVEKNGMDMGFAQISIFHDDISITYLVPSDEAASDVIQTAFGDRAVFDGESYRLEPGISRKKDLVPAITGILEGSPKE